jgi:DNA-binding MurR/RpiR family transcriptional regulator
MFNTILVKKLSVKERQLLKVMEKDYLEMIRMSITAFSKKFECSPSFITKTLKKVGYYG